MKRDPQKVTQTEERTDGHPDPFYEIIDKEILFINETCCCMLKYAMVHFWM